MSFYVDWISVAGADKDDILGKLGIEDTGKVVDWPPDSGYMWAVTPDGRIVVVADLYSSLVPAKLAMLSEGASLIGARAEGNYCTTSVWGFEDGSERWSVHCTGDDEVDLRDELVVEGSPPAALKPFFDESLKARDEDSNVSCFEQASQFAALMSGWGPETERGSELTFFAATGRKPSNGVKTAKPVNKLWFAAFVGVVAALILFQILRH
ncbi:MULTISPECIES: hypothetical protein [Phenylobacterium]|uniref:Uncharacterized protein n=1 Tax=Phenylobacterium koreense TaxID=266125 RepID=A0ABV2EFM4_9CAUL